MAILLEACWDGDLKEAVKLLASKADPCYQVAWTSVPFATMCSLADINKEQSKCFLYLQDENGRSPLMAAAKGGHTELVKQLLAKGAPWNAIDKQGKCAGEYAMEAGQQETIDILLEAGQSLLCGLLN